MLFEIFVIAGRPSSSNITPSTRGLFRRMSSAATTCTGRRSFSMITTITFSSITHPTTSSFQKLDIVHGCRLLFLIQKRHRCNCSTTIRSNNNNNNNNNIYNNSNNYYHNKTLPLARCHASSHTRSNNNDDHQKGANNKKKNDGNKNKKKNKDVGDHDNSNQVKIVLDFFGEPITFVTTTNSGASSLDELAEKEKQKQQRNSIHHISNAMASYDGFLLAVVSKGLSCTGGGYEGGLEIKGAHAAAISWSELLRFATVWNPPPPPQQRRRENDDDASTTTITAAIHSAPMLAVLAVAPVLVQAGRAYVKHLDTLLKQTKPAAPGFPVIQMYQLAQTAVSSLSSSSSSGTVVNNVLNRREKMHLQALRYLLQNDYPTALVTYLKLLQACPGDALALSLTMDLCQTLGDRRSASRAAGSVAAYWNERQGGFITPAIPGHSMATALMAVGFAVDGRVAEAEQMAEHAMNRGTKVAGGLATWAQCHIFDAKGRVAEGISALANFDGIHNYEGSGFLFFDCRLSGYGARFSLDREERGRGKSAALRLYEENFDRVLGYSGFGQGQAWTRPMQRAPLSWKEPNIALEGGDDSSNKPSFFDRLLGREPSKATEKKLDIDLIIQQVNYPSTTLDGWEPSAEDVLTWIPPTPQLLSDATLLCLRFVLNGTISTRNARWDHIRNAWSTMVDIQREHGSSQTLAFCPLVGVVASLLLPPQETGGDRVGTGRLAEGLHLMGEMLKLGNPETEEEKETSIREFIAERNPNFWLPSTGTERHQWKKIVDQISSAIYGLDDSDTKNDIDYEEQQYANPALCFQAWDFEARPVLEHAVVYAACKAGDLDSLCLARSICCHGVTIRCNSPEEWWRYSIVLGLLGDSVGSDDALNNSINLGGGQGARGTRAM